MNKYEIKRMVKNRGDKSYTQYIKNLVVDKCIDLGGSFLIDLIRKNVGNELYLKDGGNHKSISIITSEFIAKKDKYLSVSKATSKQWLTDKNNTTGYESRHS